MNEIAPTIIIIIIIIIIILEMKWTKQQTVVVQKLDKAKGHNING